MNNKLTQRKPQKWPSLLFQQSRLKHKKNTIDSQPYELQRSNSSQWIKTILTGTFNKKTPPKTYEDSSSDTVSTISAPLPDTPISFSSSSFIEGEDCEMTGDDDINSIERDPPLRYKAGRLNKRHYMIRPFEPTYEIELHKNQWLQLDLATSKQIERLRRKGFSKITIRDDASLKKHIQYDKPGEMDVLMELSLFDDDDSKSESFSVRRTFWWQTSDQVGKAYLPDYTSFCKKTQHPFKPLQYAQPPSYMDESTISF